MGTDPTPEPITPEEMGELFTFKNNPTEIIEGDGHITAWALAWFPEDQWEEAIELWPALLDTMPRDHREYSRRIESHLKASASTGPGSPDVSPLAVAELVSRFGEGAGEPLSRAKLGADMSRQGKATTWPPGRNDRCWCGSGVKYKNCCGPIPSAAF